MKIDLLNLVKSSKIFSSLDEKSIKKLLSQFEKINLDKNEVLFKEGDIDASLYLLVSGKLTCSLYTANRVKKKIYSIKPGETVGELSALSQEPRHLTVKASIKSIVLKLPSETFHKIILNQPGIIHEIIEEMTKHSRILMDTIADKKPTIKDIIIIPANKNISLETFSKKLTQLIKKKRSVQIFSDWDEVIETGKLEKSEIKKTKNAINIYLLKSTDTELAKKSFQHSEMIYVLGHANQEPEISDAVLKKITDNIDSLKINPELILLHDDDHLSKNTIKWLKLMKFGLHHHLRMHNQKDWQRLLRFIRGKVFALVLGGGGLRSWAHLGVIKALVELDVPIDIIGGTSAGAIVAGYYSLYETYLDPEKKLDELSEAARNTTSLTNITWPAVSIFNGRSFTEKLEDIFEHTKIEDLWLPYFCVTTNLSNNTPVIYRKGHLWKSIRSSTAVPAVFPPVVIKGKMYIDGGIMNNLPVDIMKKLINNRGTVIAVELTHRQENGKSYHFPPILPFWKTMFSKIGIDYKNFKFPHFIDNFLKSLLAGSAAKQSENARSADLLISPDLSKYHLLNVSRADQEELFKIGYNTAYPVIKKWKKK